MSAGDERLQQFIDELRIIHSVLRRGLAKASTQWSQVVSSSLYSFAVYSKALLLAIHSHHHHEDDLIFPFFKEKNLEGWSDITSGLHKDHADLVELLDETLPIVEKAIQGANAQNFDVLHEVKDDLQSRFAEIERLILPHLAKEEDYVTVQVLKDAGITVTELDDINAKIAAANKGMEDGHIVLPFCLWNSTDEEYDTMWRQSIPAFVRKIIVGFVMYYQGASAIVPHCDFHRNTWDA